jgi:hypothetical protein
LSDADWHFFLNQENSCACRLLNVCTTAQQYIGTNVSLPKGKRSKKSEEIFS